jgi:hypothetical protein
MTLSQFNCPHCSGPFQIDALHASLQVACPHCRQPVALMSEPPVSEPLNSEPPVAEPPLIEPPPAKPQITEIPVSRSRGYSPTDLLPPGAVVSPQRTVPPPADDREAITDAFRSRQIVADDRASRKFVKNMIVWVCCAIVLVSILAFFLRQAGS